MSQLNYDTPDSLGNTPNMKLLGTVLRHLGRNKLYQITGFCWMGETDVWGFLACEIRDDCVYGPNVARPLDHINGNRSNGEPRYEVMQ